MNTEKVCFACVSFCRASLSLMLLPPSFRSSLLLQRALSVTLQQRFIPDATTTKRLNWTPTRGKLSNSQRAGAAVLMTYLHLQLLVLVVESLQVALQKSKSLRGKRETTQRIKTLSRSILQVEVRSLNLVVPFGSVLR